MQTPAMHPSQRYPDPTRTGSLSMGVVGFEGSSCTHVCRIHGHIKCAGMGYVRIKSPSMNTLSDFDYEELIKHEEEKRLLKLLRTRGQVPLIPESSSNEVPHLGDIQGDILFRFPKTLERFVFFRIAKSQSKQFLVALKKFEPTSAADVKENMLEICREKDNARKKNEERLEAEGVLGKARRLRRQAARIEQGLTGAEVDEAEVKPIRIPLKQKMIAFTRDGLDEIGYMEKTGDRRFDNHPMLHDKTELGDQSDWDLLFAWNEKEKEATTNGLGRNAKDNREATTGREPLHGVVIIATENSEELEEVTEQVDTLFKGLWEKMGTLDGSVRPDKNRGHEHFGFLDGISQPSIHGIEHPLPGQLQVNPGVIVMGYPGDPVSKWDRASWTKGGTMMVFRKLEQSVLEFKKYCRDNGQRWKEFVPGGERGALKMGFDGRDGEELFAARFVGRWKSGAPLALCPFKDNPALAADPKQNNDFDYAVTGVRGVSDREPSDYYCPFTAHARKTVPRNLDPYISRKYLESSAIVRAAIPYGPEINTDEEEEWIRLKDEKDNEMRSELRKKQQNASHEVDETKLNTFQPDPKDRGLLFSCYASHLDSGFVRQTTGFGNNDFFPITSLTPTHHGQDPIIGGPPAKGSSAQLRRVLQISEPINPSRPYPEEPEIQTASKDLNASKKADGCYQVADKSQVYLELVPENPNSSSKKFEVTGIVKAIPEGRPAPGEDNPFFVTSRGGEYFFVPSIPALRYFSEDDHIGDLLMEHGEKLNKEREERRDEV
ncbi:unnamed protein product [Rhizoctonia solani]|uniref:DyP dimeric alpha+beta barrel domain-containing protein n=1 Tax=Rhizoctonia solani TaxID=456999 RepID=A0A8H2ZVS5_9AGAM|nr:unnamed protein product [Rhizoctonia solani]